MQPQPGNAVALPAGYATGLEDFDVSDLKLPRLGIDHENGTFKDNLSNMQFETISIIPLGLIKQRVLWHPVVPEGKNDSVPMCKSTDHNTGFPTVGTNDVTKDFPWAAAQWNPTDFPMNEEGRLTLPCQSCRLKDWGSFPVDGKKTWCAEQHTIALLYGPEGAEPGMTALFTAQRSSINASKAFFASIARRQLPAFAITARVTLTAQMRGKNKYYVPAFVETGLTEQGNWAIYSESYMSVRTFITQPPRLKDDKQQQQNTGNIGQTNTIQGQFSNNTWVPGQPQPQPQQPVQQPAYATQHQYTQPAQPQQQYAQPAPTHPLPPPTHPLPPPPMTQQPAPQAPPPPVAAPPVQHAPAQAGGGTARDDDDLPF